MGAELPGQQQILLIRSIWRAVGIIAATLGSSRIRPVQICPRSLGVPNYPHSIFVAKPPNTLEIGDNLYMGKHTLT